MAKTYMIVVVVGGIFWFFTDYNNITNLFGNFSFKLQSVFQSRNGISPFRLFRINLKTHARIRLNEPCNNWTPQLTLVFMRVETSEVSSPLISKYDISLMACSRSSLAASKNNLANPGLLIVSLEKCAAMARYWIEAFNSSCIWLRIFLTQGLTMSSQSFGTSGSLCSPATSPSH